jgi:hypothetical protein
MVRTFRDLNVWRKAHNLVLEIYKITMKFPREEKYGNDLLYLNEKDFDALMVLCDEIGRMLYGFHKKLTTYDI